MTPAPGGFGPQWSRDGPPDVPAKGETSKTKRGVALMGYRPHNTYQPRRVLAYICKPCESVGKRRRFETYEELVAHRDGKSLEEHSDQISA